MSSELDDLTRDGGGPEREASGLVDAALVIVARRRETKRALRDALLRGDDREALRLSRVLVGLEDEISDRTNSRLN